MTHHQYFASCTRGLESALLGELTDLGARDLDERRGGVAFQGGRALGYRANLWLRSAIRVQEQLLRARAATSEELYDVVTALPWEQWVSPDQTLAVFATTRDTPALKHSGYVALRIKDAVVDRVRGKRGRRPSVDPRQPDVPIKAVIHGGRLLLYRDLSGPSLHKRGWRPIQVKSPLNEATAAGLLRLAQWEPTQPLVDPMCGSGTLLVEAAWMAMDRAPGLSRSFVFEQWIDHVPDVWEDLRTEARDRVQANPDVVLAGADAHRGALALAAQGAQRADVGHLVTWTASDARAFVPPTPPAVVVTNPPYGKRIGRDESLVDAWQSLGNFLHQQCRGATAWVLSGNPWPTRFLGLRASRRIPVMNGPIACRWLRYDIRNERRPT